LPRKVEDLAILLAKNIPSFLRKLDNMEPFNQTMKIKLQNIKIVAFQKIIAQQQ